MSAHVCIVFLPCACIQVVRVDALTVATAMAHKHSLWDRANVMLIREAMACPVGSGVWIA